MRAGNIIRLVVETRAPSAGMEGLVTFDSLVMRCVVGFFTRSDAGEAP